MSDDPVADFLSREQDQLAELGDDFTISNSNNEFDSLNVPNGELIDGFGVEQQEWEEQQQSDIPLELESASNADPYAAISGADFSSAESDYSRRWKAEFEAKVAEKDAEEARSIEEWREAARHELDAWARNHEEQLAKVKEANREEQEAFVQERDHGTPGGEWERVAKLCDFSSKTTKQTKDVSRMRSILFRLKTEPLVR